MRNVRTVVAAAAALVVTACATTQSRPVESSIVRPPGTCAEEIRFNGYRLVLQPDKAGLLSRPQAYDPNDKPVPTFMVPFEDVKVCPPKAVDLPGGGTMQCEPFNILPDRTSFKTGANSLCWFVVGRKLVYYPC